MPPDKSSSPLTSYIVICNHSTNVCARYLVFKDFQLANQSLCPNETHIIMEVFNIKNKPYSMESNKCG